jgi:hypothetical protein
MPTASRHPALPAAPPRRLARPRPGAPAAWSRWAVAGLAGLAVSGAAAADEGPWPVAGYQGLLQVVIVPAAQATDMAAYKTQIARLCPGDRTCFVNFFTNSTGAKAELPLPDAIAEESTARFRRSTKNGAELFQWSCRLRLGGECF